MSIKETQKKETRIPEDRETMLDKVKEIADKAKQERLDSKKAMSLEEYADALSQRLEQRKTKEETGTRTEGELNQAPVEIGIAGCEAFCRKVHDGTKVHGTYH